MAGGFGHHRRATGNAHVAQTGIMASRAGRARNGSVRGRCGRCGAAQNKRGIAVAGAAIQCPDRDVVDDHVLAAASPNGSRRAAAMTDQTGCPQRRNRVAGMGARGAQECGVTVGVGCGMAGITRRGGGNVGDDGILFDHAGIRCAVGMAGRAGVGTDERVTRCTHDPAAGKAARTGAARRVAQFAGSGSDRHMDTGV